MYLLCGTSIPMLYILPPCICCAFLLRRHATSGGKQQVVLCLDGLFTLSCLRALIECERQSVLQNPVFGHLQEVLIHLSESNQVNLLVLVLFLSCLLACSRVVYTQASCKIIHIQQVTCHKFHHCPLPLESSHYGWSIFVQGWHKQIHPSSRKKIQQTI